MSRGRQNSLPALLFLIFSPLYRLNCSPLPPPPLCSQHAYNCYSLKFNSAPCPTTPQTTTPSSTSTHTHFTTILILDDAPSSLISPLLNAPWSPQVWPTADPRPDTQKGDGIKKSLAFWSQRKSRWPLSWPLIFQVHVVKGAIGIRPHPTLKTEKREHF